MWLLLRLAFSAFLRACLGLCMPVEMKTGIIKFTTDSVALATIDRTNVVRNNSKTHLITRIINFAALSLSLSRSWSIHVKFLHDVALVAFAVAVFLIYCCLACIFIHLFVLCILVS